MKKIEIEPFQKWFFISRWQSNIYFMSFSIFNDLLILYSSSWRLEIKIWEWDEVYKNWKLIYKNKNKSLEI